MNALPKVIPINELKNTSQISKTCQDSRVPIVITKNGHGDMVLMSISLYEETFAKMQAAILINDAYSKIEKGAKGIDADTFFDNLN